MLHTRTIAVCLLMMTYHLASAQTTLTIADGSAASCLGILLDSGNTGGEGYSNNEDITFTLCPDQPDVNLMMTFQSFDLDQSGDVGTWDNLSIYDGDDIDAPSLGTYTGTELQNLSVSATLFNATGCLTFRFRSNDIGTGVFAASFACVVPCDPPTAVANMTIPTPARICPGEEHQFDGSASFAVPGQSIVMYNWQFGANDTASGPLVSHVFNAPGTYPILLAIDDNACESMNSVELVVA
ncbi:MAG: PKD domain-containing protein [Flavobacteriales bacterium]